MSAAETEIGEIEAAIRKSIDVAENRRLATRRKNLETRIGQLHAGLSLDHPLNDIVVDAYNAHERWKIATQTLMHTIRNRKLTVHDGRGRELNHSVWTHPKFRYYLDLSIVVNPSSSGEPRRQAARINRDQFDNWLATLTPLVEVTRDRSPEEKLTELLSQYVVAAKDGKGDTKAPLRRKALKEIPGATGRMFDRVWSNVVPENWRKGGAPRRARKAR